MDEGETSIDFFLAQHDICAELVSDGHDREVQLGADQGSSHYRIVRYLPSLRCIPLSHPIDAAEDLKRSVGVRATRKAKLHGLPPKEKLL